MTTDDKVEVPFSLQNDRKVHTSFSALEILIICDNMVENQCKNNPYLWILLLFSN